MLYINLVQYQIQCFIAKMLHLYIGLPIRLVNGRTANEGRVEIYYKNSWATVCDDGWDNTDASVVCKQLGFSSTGTAVGSAGFGQGSGVILLDDVRCTSSQINLFNCHHYGFEYHNCGHSEDAGVRCGSLPGNHLLPTRIRAVQLII